MRTEKEVEGDEDGVQIGTPSLGLSCDLITKHRALGYVGGGIPDQKYSSIVQHLDVILQSLNGCFWTDCYERGLH